VQIEKRALVRKMSRTKKKKKKKKKNSKCNDGGDDRSDRSKKAIPQGKIKGKRSEWQRRGKINKRERGLREDTLLDKPVRRLPDPWRTYHYCPIRGEGGKKKRQQGEWRRKDGKVLREEVGSRGKQQRRRNRDKDSLAKKGKRTSSVRKIRERGPR